MKKIYPGDTKDAIEVFRLYEAQGEYFDISNPSNIVRDTITIGKTEAVQTGYFIGKECIGCKLCYSVCPQNALIYLQFRLLSTRIIVCIAEDVQKFVRSSVLRKEVHYDFKKIRKGYADWRNFLCSTPARDYVFQKDAYEDQIDRAAKNIRNTDCVIIGAGAGASTAAGIQYGGKRFTDNFAEFIKKYGEYYMTDMYAAGFYPYPSEEAKWGYWSKHALMNRFDPPALPLYTELYDLVKNKEYFVLTTNVDHQFYKAGFDEKRIFATQGDYGKIQCQKACHSKTYDAKDLFRKMDKARRDCLIPSELVPKCPVCGGNMAMNLRCDNYFVEDEAWHEAADRYAGFLEQHKDKKVVLLELGVGFNTPIIIRFPFEKMVRENSSYSLIRLNMDEAVVPESFGERAIGIGGDMAKAITDIRGLVL